MRARPNLWKGLAAGLIGGLAGSWIMTKYQEAYSAVSETLRRPNGQAAGSGGSSGSPNGSEDATMKAAGKLSLALRGRELSLEQKRKAGPLVHYAFGSLVGGLYGISAEFAPAVKSFGGVPFAAAVFASADEIAVPAFKLSGPPAEYPLSAHANALASHVVYGVTTEVVRRVVRTAL